MRRIIVFLMLWSLASGACVFAGEPVTTIHFVSEEWEEATEADGTGLYWDLFRLVYEPVGITVEFDILPYARGTKMVQQQQADASVAAYRDEFDAFFPQWHFDRDIVTALFKKGQIETWEGEKSLHGKLGWIRGYEYDQYLTTPPDFVEVDTRKSALRMLEIGRLDFYLDALEDIEIALKQGEVNPDDFQMETVLKLNLYLAFAKNDRGEFLKKVFDERMTELVASGELKTLFDKWETFYPFDK